MSGVVALSVTLYSYKIIPPQTLNQKLLNFMLTFLKNEITFACDISVLISKLMESYATIYFLMNLSYYFYGYQTKIKINLFIISFPNLCCLTHISAFVPSLTEIATNI